MNASAYVMLHRLFIGGSLDKIGIFRKMLSRSKINSVTDVDIEYELNIS